jgi:hypothetical protein
VFVADDVREQRREQGQNSNFFELGLVQELTHKLKLAAGVGAGMGEESPDVTSSLGVPWDFRDWGP